MKVLTSSEKRVMISNIAELQKIFLESVSDPKAFIRGTDLLADMALIVGGSKGILDVKELVEAMTGVTAEVKDHDKVD